MYEIIKMLLYRLEFNKAMFISNQYECKFRDRDSIPSVCQITDADLGQVG